MNTKNVRTITQDMACKGGTPEIIANSSNFAFQSAGALQEEMGRDAGGGGEDSRGIQWASHQNKIINIMLSDFLNSLVF